MTIDFRAEVDKRKDALMEDLLVFLRINSERDDSKVDDKHPFGPGPVKALEHFLALAERDGYKLVILIIMLVTLNLVKVMKYWVSLHTWMWFQLGVVGIQILYEPVIKDGKLYARGSSDDKGPTMACYYALKIIKEPELQYLRVCVSLLVLMKNLVEAIWIITAHNGLKDPDFGFSPDAEFPIINGEKGNIIAYLHFEGQNDGEFSLVSFNGGLRENMVPGICKCRFHWTYHFERT